jgi:hypothetical protein
MSQDKVVVLFSGGVDSTLTAAIAAERFSQVYLVTYKRLGIFKVKSAYAKIGKLIKKYPDSKFIPNIIDFNNFYREISYEKYFLNISRFGIKLMSVCGLCRLAMHWRTVIFCIDNKISAVYDGASIKSKTFPEQNRTIMNDKLIEFYRSFGIKYETPVYFLIDTEERLFNKGLIPKKKIKQTEADLQPLCIDNFLFAQFVNYYLNAHSWDEYEKDLSEFYSYKISWVKDRLVAYNKNG